MARVYVSIGSNIDKERNICSSIKALRGHFGRLNISNVYATKAVGFDGDDFHNLVVGFDSKHSPQRISQILRQIEAEHGRTRSKEQFESRTLDLDQLLHADLVMRMDGVNLPHPDILRYNFVLKPLTELAGQVVHPQEARTIVELWGELREKSVENGGLKLVEYEFHADT